MEPETDVLVFVEDPGAANLVLGLPEELGQNNLTVVILASGAASTSLSSAGVRSVPLQADHSASQILSQYAPRVLVCGTAENQDSMGLHLIAEARRQNLATVGLVDAVMNAEFRFRGKSSDPLMFQPDWIFATGKKTAEQFQELGVDAEKIKIFRNPAFLYVEKAKRKLAKRNRQSERARIFGKENADKNIICFLTERSDGLNPSEFLRNDDYLFSGRGQTVERTKIVLEEVLEQSKKHRDTIAVALRLHPKEMPQDYSDYQKEVFLIDPQVSALSSVFFADLVLGLSTTLLEEARRLGCRVYSVVPRNKEREWVAFPSEHEDLIISSRYALSGAIRSALEKRKEEKEEEDRVDHVADPSLARLLVDMI